MNRAGRPGVGVAVFIWRGDKFLLYQRHGSHGHETWSVPGGHLEFGESWAECAAREALEEVGVRIKNVQFLAVTNDIFKAESKTLYKHPAHGGAARRQTAHHGTGQG